MKQVLEWAQTRELPTALAFTEDGAMVLVGDHVGTLRRSRQTDDSRDSCDGLLDDEKAALTSEVSELKASHAELQSGASEQQATLTTGRRRKKAGKMESGNDTRERVRILLRC